jgi:hypothetical protein
MTTTYAPQVAQQFFDNDGEPAVGYQLFCYEAGTTTKATTYTDEDGLVVNTNPIILDSAGRCTIRFTEGSYKLVLASPTDTDPPASAIWTRDNISSVPAYDDTTSLASQVADTWHQNWWYDSCFDIWPAGDSSAPTDWVLSGTGATVARSGAGGTEVTTPTDDTALSWGSFCCKLTYGSAAAYLTRTLLSSVPAALKGKTLTVACRCKTSSTAAAVVITDGVDTTIGGSTGTGTYHAGDGTEDWIYLAHTISSSATGLAIKLMVGASGSAYFGAGLITWGEIVPTDWLRERVGKYVVGVSIPGTLAVGDVQGAINYDVPDYCLFAGLFGSVNTAPVGAAITFDVDKTTDLSTYNAAYDTTLPDIDATEQQINDGARATPNGEYQYRCLAPNDFMAVNIDQVGSGTAGSDFTGSLIFLVPINEWALLTFTP